MRFFIYCLVVLVFTHIAAQSASASELFLKPNAPADSAAHSGSGENPAPMKPESTTESTAESTAGKTIKDYANAYYQNCQKTEHPILAGNDLKMLCGCTASKFAEVMSVEQIKEMENGTSEGLYQRNRMMMFVYAPCIEYPTRAMIMKECMSKTQNEYLMKNQRATCGCLADGVAKDMAELAPKFIERAMRYNSKDLDPLNQLMNSDAFEKRSIYHTRVCLSKHEGL